MSKNFSRAFIEGQYNSMTAKTNAERIKFTVAGVKDGKFYDHAGTDYGLFDIDAPDVIFIPDTDIQLTRITGAKLTIITGKMNKYFEEYYGESEAPIVEEDNVEPEASVETVEEEDTIDTEAVIEACKKAIKKGKFDKAQKLIDKLGGHKKLQKKLDKAQ